MRDHMVGIHILRSKLKLSVWKSEAHFIFELLLVRVCSTECGSGMYAGRRCISCPLRSSLSALAINTLPVIQRSCSELCHGTMYFGSLNLSFGTSLLTARHVVSATLSAMRIALTVPHVLSFCQCMCHTLEGTNLWCCFCAPYEESKVWIYEAASCPAVISYLHARNGWNFCSCF